MADKILTADELIAILRKGGKKYRWSQIHHTYRPNHASFNGKNHLDLQRGMRNYHVNVRGWNDIGQHVTLMPDGLFVTGRDFNDDSVDFDDSPAGISGYNGGAFMTEILGDFDKGKDKLEGDQLEAILKLNHYLVYEAGAEILFHREKAPKTCPGTGIDKGEFIKAVADIDPNKAITIEKPKTQVKSEVVINYLNKGDKGSNVTLLQKKLVSLGYKLDVDGVFGPGTDAVVKQFQKDNGLIADGIIGPKTSEALGKAKPIVVRKPVQNGSSILRAGSKGPEVVALQNLLNRNGFNAGKADGIFGGQTETALKQFQTRVGLSVDGIYGPNSKSKLESYKKVGYPGTLIKEGSEGKFVKLVQEIVGVKADGIFGPNTKKAVQEWQRKNRLVADGLVGPSTWNKMF